MGLVDEVLSRFASHARQRYLQLDFDAEAIGNGAYAHGSVDRHISRDSDFVARSNELHCTDKARAVTGGKKLFGVGAFLALATQSLRPRQLQVQSAFRCHSSAFPASGSLGVRT